MADSNGTSSPRNQDVYDAEACLSFAFLIDVIVLEGVMGYDPRYPHLVHLHEGRGFTFTQELLQQVNAMYCKVSEHALRAEAAAPDTVLSMAARGYHSFSLVGFHRRHALPDFSPEARASPANTSCHTLRPQPYSSSGGVR